MCLTATRPCSVAMLRRIFPLRPQGLLSLGVTQRSADRLMAATRSPISTVSTGHLSTISASHNQPHFMMATACNWPLGDQSSVSYIHPARPWKQEPGPKRAGEVLNYQSRTTGLDCAQSSLDRKRNNRLLLLPLTTLNYFLNARLMANRIFRSAADRRMIFNSMDCSSRSITRVLSTRRRESRSKTPARRTAFM